MESKNFFMDAGDGAMSTMHRELQELKRSTKRCQKILTGLLLLFGLILLTLIIVVGVQSRKISHLRKRQGLIPHPNVTFASNSGDKSVYGLAYGGSLFRGSGFWSSRTNLPGSLTDHAAITVNESIYIIGGADESGNVTDAVWRFDPIFHNYTRMNPMPAPRYRFGATLDSSSTKIYVTGGRSNDSDGCVLTTFVFDLGTLDWTTGPDMLECQSDNCAASLFDKVYVFGGYSTTYDYLNTTEVYDPKEDTWTYGEPLPTARGDSMCASLDGELYVVGGYEDGGPENLNSFSAKVESFDPNTTTWTTQPSLLTPRGDGAITVLSGQKLMVVGGEGHYKNNDLYKYPKHVNEIYYAQDKTWVEKAMIPTARFRTAAATVDGLSFVFGGAEDCILTAQNGTCPALNVTEVFLDVDHPHVYLYLKDEAYNDNQVLTTYPL